LCSEHVNAVHDGNITAEEFVNLALTKWSFIVNDRVNTEKATNRKLIEWCDESLSNAVGDSTQDTVHTFFCSARVLLGFHRNCIKALDVKEKLFCDNHKLLGRDALPRFWGWNHYLAVERAVRMTSEVLGPLGDYIGLKDRWEAAGGQEISLQIVQGGPL